MAKTSSTISGAEMAILKAVWDGGPGTVREIGARPRGPKRQWAYTTVQTLLNRLEAKGFVACDRSGVPHVFSAAVSRDKLVRQRLRDLADELCEGTATPLVAALVQGRKFSTEEIEQFRRLVDELEPRKR